MEDTLTIKEEPSFELFPGTYCFKIEGGNELISNANEPSCLGNGEELFICHHCGFSSDWRKLFVKHVKDHRSDVDKSRSEHKTLKNATLAVFAVAKLQESTPLKHHRNRITGKLYACSDCSYKALRADILKVHQRIHSGEKPYGCCVCSYKATTSSLLNIHMRVHSGEKPYACSICTYKATTSNNLSIHQRSHSGVKPYACSVCSYKSTTSSALKRHLKRVHR